MNRANVRTAAGVVAVLLAVGLVAGVVWWWVAPQPFYRVEADGLYFLGDQPQEYVAADGWFAVITGLIGVCAGVVVWLRCRATGQGAVVGLFAGGLAGAALAAAVGMLLGSADPFAAPVGSISQGPLELRAWGVLLIEAGAALSVWLLLDLLVLRDEPGDTFEVPSAAEDRPDYGAIRDL